MDRPLLVGDIGGTNARFAIVDETGNRLALKQSYLCANFATVTDAIHHYLKQVGLALPRVICLAVAGPVVDEQVSLTNNQWQITAFELRQNFALEFVWLLNDFEAIAYSVPFLLTNEILAIGSLEPSVLNAPQYSIAILGPGTGLGTVGLRKYQEHYITILSEASHGGFAPETSEQIEILTALGQRFGRVSCERLLSGSGLENLYWALNNIHQQPERQLLASDIVLASLNNCDPLASKAVDIFYRILGQVAGDLALTLGANDGVYIAGGITQRYPEQIINSQFREGFESKGRHRNLMERIPTQLITHQQPGLLGAANHMRARMHALV